MEKSYMVYWYDKRDVLKHTIVQIDDLDVRDYGSVESALAAHIRRFHDGHNLGKTDFDHIDRFEELD